VKLMGSFEDPVAVLENSSMLGTYAIAVSMFAEIFRQMPADLPAAFTLANGTQVALDPAQARMVQHGAWQAHLQYGRAGK